MNVFATLRPFLPTFRGWTDGLIKSFRLQPDKEVSNPRYRKAPARKLYDLGRVEKLEAERPSRRDSSGGRGAGRRLPKP
jgi:hypothetical protein